MKQVRAKLVCTTVQDQTDGATANPQKTGENVSFMAQYSDNKEDNSFSQYTPSANMSMNVTNPEIFGFFKEGEAYYFDITSAAPAQEVAASEEKGSAQSNILS